MSEQEVDLDTAIQQFQLVETFDEYKEGLSELLHTCTTDEEVKRAGEVIEEQKQRLREANPEFNAIMESREQENKQRAELDRAVHRAKMAEVEAKAQASIAGAVSSVRGVIPQVDTDEWIARTKLKIASPEDLERKSEEGLWCPICRKKDTAGNIINDEPACMRVNESGRQCFHKLVPQEDLKNYNREYRRKWARRRKK